MVQQYHASWLFPLLLCYVFMMSLIHLILPRIHYRDLTLHIQGKDDLGRLVEIIKIKKPSICCTRCCAEEATVQLPHGEVIGHLRHNAPCDFSCRPIVSLLDKPNGKELARFVGGMHYLPSPRLLHANVFVCLSASLLMCDN